MGGRFIQQKYKIKKLNEIRKKMCALSPAREIGSVWIGSGDCRDRERDRNSTYLCYLELEK